MPDLRITTSWDDGDLAVPKLADRLRHFGLAGTFFIPADNLEGRPVLPASEIRHLAEGGFEIAAHGSTHRRLPSLSPDQVRQEISDGRRRLEDVLGSSVKGFAYPGGHPGRYGRHAAKEAGFTYARTTEMFRLDAGLDRFLLGTTLQIMPHGATALLRNLLRRGDLRHRWRVALCALQNPRDVEAAVAATLALWRRSGGVVHLWGHAWEIDAFGLWPMLDRVFALLAATDPAAVRLTNQELMSP